MKKHKIIIFFKMAMWRLAIVTFPFLVLGGFTAVYNNVQRGYGNFNCALFLLILSIILSICEGIFFARYFVRHKIKLTSQFIQVNAILLVLTTLVYIIFSDTSIQVSRILYVVFNPFHAFHVIIMENVFDQGKFIIIFTSVLISNLTLIFYTKKLYLRKNPENKPRFSHNDKLVFTILVIFGVSGIAINCINAIPEIEYFLMRKKFAELNFNEEVDDYNFHVKTPFNEDNDLPELEEMPTLVFKDVETTPRLDGATAFYPLYSAYVNSTYKGFQEYVEKENLMNYHNYFVSPDIQVIKNNVLINPEYQDIISCTKTDEAYRRLLGKKVDVIFTFEPSAHQLQSFADAGEELEMTTIGYDAFTFFVSVDNKVDNLSLDQVQKMYTGQIKNWKKVGGANKRVFAFQRPEGSGSQTIMENVVMKDKKLNPQFKAHMVTTMGGMLNVVGGYLNVDNAIGYTFMYYSSSMVTSNEIKYLSIDGVYPSPESLKSESYIFTTPFYAVSLKSNKSNEVNDLLTWITGEQGQELLVKTGYVGL